MDYKEKNLLPMRICYSEMFWFLQILLIDIAKEKQEVQLLGEIEKRADLRHVNTKKRILCQQKKVV